MSEDNKYKVSREVFLEWCKASDTGMTKRAFIAWAEDKEKPKPPHQEELMAKWVELFSAFF